MFGSLPAALTAAFTAFARRGTHGHPAHHTGPGHHAGGPHKAGAKAGHVHQARKALAKVPAAKPPAKTGGTRTAHGAKRAPGTKQTPTTKGNVRTNGKTTSSAPSGIGRPGYNRAQPRNNDGEWA